eukprot:4825925-Pleurochrysis_carterae.AAC.4
MQRTSKQGDKLVGLRTGRVIVWLREAFSRQDSLGPQAGGGCLRRAPAGVTARIVRLNAEVPIMARGNNYARIRRRPIHD